MTHAGTRLAGKITFITAAGQGIGRATALAFAGEGAEVWATDIRPASLKALAAEAPGLRTQLLDVRDSEAVARLARELPRLDVLFNCAGIVPHGTVMDCTEAEWDTCFDVNIKSMYRTARSFLPRMLAAGRGNIINMASVVSSITGAPNRFVYAATKGAVIGLTKALAVDYAARGIRCNAICPGTIETPSMQRRLEATGDAAEARRAFIARQPMGRIGTPEEVAALAVFLASDESAFCTGHTYVVDGGWAI